MTDAIDLERRRWADIVVILTGLGLMGLAIWPTPFASAAEVGGRLTVWQVYALAGGLTLAGLFTGQLRRWRAVARALLLGAVAVLAFGLVTTFRDLGTVAFLTVIVPGLLLLLAAPFFGRMPRAVNR